MDVLACFILLSALLSPLLLLKLGKRPKPHQKRPPGPWRLPVIGSVHHLRGPVPQRSLRALSTKHGPLMYLQLGQVPTIVVSSADVARQIMKTHDLNFADRPRFRALRTYTYGYTDVGLASYGEYWRQVRRILVLELLTAKRVESFRALREEEFRRLIGSIADSENSVINLTKMIYASHNNIVGRAAFGSFRHQELFLETIEKAFEFAGGFHPADLFPSSKLIPWITGMNFRLERYFRKFDTIFDSIIKEHQQKKAEREVKQGAAEEDLIDILLKIQEQDDLEVPITVDNIKAIILDILTGGTETSSTLLTWTMLELIRNPALMTKAQEEVRRVLRGKTKVSEEDVQEMPYLKSIIKESMRLHPPIPLLIPRECRESCEINGHQIAIKTRVIVNAWAIGRDPQVWGDDAESFKPERFLHSSVDFKGTHMEFIPFGAGRRICPGILFGMANVEVPLAQFLYYFDWKLPGGMTPEDVDVREKPGFGKLPKWDLLLVPTINSALPEE